MSGTEGNDDFETRRQHLRGLSDEQLKVRFWRLAHQIVAPMVEEARSHTTPSIERSVLMRMGFSSIEAQSLVSCIMHRGLLGQGAGRLVLALAKARNLPVREAGAALLRDEYWEDIVPRART